MKVLLLLFLGLTAIAVAQNRRPWPREAVAENYEVRVVSEDHATGAATYGSSHFEMTADVKLPVSVVRDLAAVFEATRILVRSMPLGIDAIDEPPSYRVMFLSTTADYTAAGGPVGSGGYYNGRAMLLLLPNLGIQKTTNGLTAAHQQNLFVLKHEVTHQIMGRWNRPLPMWLREGLAECVAATPYVRGRYTLANLDGSMRDYLLKWRRTKDQRSLRLIPAPQLLALSSDEWQRQVTAQTAYDYYNSAGLLAHWFLHHDGLGDAAGMAEYFAAIAARTPPNEALERCLLRGRTPQKIDEELRALCRKLALQIDSP